MESPVGKKRKTDFDCLLVRRRNGVALPIVRILFLVLGKEIKSYSLAWVKPISSNA